MPPEKLIFGVPSYGRSFTLADTTKTELLSSAAGAGRAGKFTGLDGFLSFYEICLYQQNGWTVVTDPTGKTGPYAYSGDQWVAWDDIDVSYIFIYYKIRYVLYEYIYKL